jgi:transposase InsO family protein
VSAWIRDHAALGFRLALCRAIKLPRASFYRDIRVHAPSIDQDEVLVERILHWAQKWPLYGYRRITQMLRRGGFVVNHKKVLRIMRERNLLVRRRRRFVATTDSDHGLAVYPNLARSLCLCHPNQLWVADMTYIRLPEGFVYLAAVLDAYSRRAVGWALSRKIDTKLTLSALTMAMQNRGAPLYHHSDRGVQYASAEYVQALTSKQVQISMSRSGNPYDNASMESFMKTLKTEEVYPNQYNTFEQVMQGIDHYIGELYNQQRLHSALGYRSPDEFELQQ